MKCNLKFIVTAVVCLGFGFASAGETPSHNAALTPSGVAEKIMKSTTDGIRTTFKVANDSDGLRLVDEWEARLLQDNDAMNALTDFVAENLGSPPRKEDADRLTRQCRLVFSMVKKEDAKASLEKAKQLDWYWPLCRGSEFAHAALQQQYRVSHPGESYSARKMKGLALTSSGKHAETKPAIGQPTEELTAAWNVANMISKVEQQAYFDGYGEKPSKDAPSTSGKSQR